MSLDDLYSVKPDSYFANARHDIVARLRTGPDARILELGCGAGGTGAATLAAGKAGHYTGIEMDSRAAALARDRLSEVIESDVETLDVSAWTGRFDALIISEVLEHLTDPWRTVTGLAACLKPGSQVFASSPNVAHWRVLRSLALGRFDYKESGVMDRTHLRWFTPATYRDMFEQAGITVHSVEPLSQAAARARFVNWLTRDRFRHLTMEQIMVVGEKA